MSWAANDYVDKLRSTPTGKPFTPAEKLLLLVLSNLHNDDTWEAEASLNTLAERTPISKSYVVRILAKMEAEDLLESITGRNERHGNLTKRYRFKHLPRPLSTRRPTPTARGASELTSPPPSELTSLGVVTTVHQASELTSPPPSELPPATNKESSLKTSETEKKEKTGSLSGKPDGVGALVVAAEEILLELNRAIKKNFRAREASGRPSANLEFIIGRLKSGASKDQCLAVVHLKVRAWRHNPEKLEYLRPATLFNREKFEQYLGEIADQQQAHRAQEARSRPRIDAPLQPIQDILSKADRDRMMVEAGLKRAPIVQTSGKTGGASA